jgi:hypothetical protein
MKLLVGYIGLAINFWTLRTTTFKVLELATLILFMVSRDQASTIIPGDILSLMLVQVERRGLWHRRGFYRWDVTSITRREQGHISFVALKLFRYFDPNATYYLFTS